MGFKRSFVGYFLLDKSSFWEKPSIREIYTSSLNATYLTSTVKREDILMYHLLLQNRKLKLDIFFSDRCKFFPNGKMPN